MVTPMSRRNRPLLKGYLSTGIVSTEKQECERLKTQALEIEYETITEDVTVQLINSELPTRIDKIEIAAKVSADNTGNETITPVINTRRKGILYVSFVFSIFAFLFVSPILSPSINGNTLYLNFFVPFLDTYFLCHILCRARRIRVKVYGMFAFLALIVIMLFHVNIMLIMRISVIFVSVVYLEYIYTRIGFRRLYAAFNINIIIAILQFALYFVNRRIAYLLGPNNISRVIWGSFATETNTNFYPLFYLPRTCGLSREAGFFAALLSIIVLIYITDSKIRKTRGQKLLFLIAYVVSLSKMSFLLVVMIVILRYSKFIDKIPVMLVVIIFTVCSGICVNILNANGFLIPVYESFAHRLWGYGVVFSHLNLKEFLFGNSLGAEGLNVAALNAFPIHEYLFTRGFTNFCGLPSVIIYIGYLGLLSFVTFLKSMGVKSGHFLILLVSTFDVDLMTTTSFVMLAYWFTIYSTKRSFSR